MDAFRHSLKARGVTDVIFQNKILSLVLQSKAGLQFALGNVLNGLLMDNNHMFLMQSDYNVNINVIDGQHIKLTLEGNWRNIRSETDAPDLKADITVDISSEKVSIESFQVTQLSNSPETKSAFKFLEANQAGLLEKIFIF
ncbi:hypothetical protein, partial [uncultured Legionella sp.]|uniref:hypothetical protein n=1 Tax=uncultured Legionella sp. TaxID=210934 RepID=UPI002633A4FB